MDMLTERHRGKYQEFCEFSRQKVAPCAGDWERKEGIPRATLDLLAAAGYLGGSIPPDYGGGGWDCLTYGLFNEAVGKDSVSLTGLFNVHTMVAQTLVKWGTETQKSRWLPPLAEGTVTGAFALTEPGAGSDIQSITSEYREDKECFVLNGTKRWITFGETAGIYLVFGQSGGKSLVCLVERDTPGLTVTPVKDMLGYKAAHLAVLEFDNCRIDKANLIARPGFAFSHVAPYALDYGRLNVAFAALGILRGCLELCGRRVLERKTFDRRLIEHGPVGALLADMGVEREAAWLLAVNAAKKKDNGDPDATGCILGAKYYAARAAARHAANAVQIMGAVGCNEQNPVARYYRDAKIMEIIEGSDQICQMLLGRRYAKKFKRTNR